LREIFRQERLAPLPAAYQLAWMTAFNAGLLDGYTPETLPGALQALLDGLVPEPLALDAPREAWLAKLKDWLGGVP